MRWEQREIGARKTVRRFAFLPTEMDGDQAGTVAWLEWYFEDLQWGDGPLGPWWNTYRTYQK